MPSTKSSWVLDLLFITITLFCLFFALLGVRPLFAPDEGRYAEIAREMIERSDYITPYLNSIKYFEKPALFYWLVVGSIKLFGLNLWSVRAVNALLAVIGALATYITARILYGRQAGLLAGFILSTSLLYFVMAHMVSLDLTVSVFLSICLYAVLLSSQTEPPCSRRLLMWLAAAMAGCALLTKGLIGIVFPGAIVTLWLAMTGEWRHLNRYYLPSSLLIFLLVALPWHLMVGMRNPEFFHFYFIEQQFLRYTTMNIGHYQPAWFFIPCLVAGFFPWIAFLPQSISHSFRDKNNLFFLIWFAFIFAFFSFSKSKLIPYIVPIFPALAMLTANYLADAMRIKTTRGIKCGFMIILLLAIAISYVLYDFVATSTVPNKSAATTYLGLATLFLLGGALFSAIYCNKQLRLAIISTVVTTAAFLILVIAAIPAIDSRTILPLATTIQAQLGPDDDIITYNQYFQDLPFYLQKRITILNWRNEMTFGMAHQETSEWMIDDAGFWKRWHGKHRVFVIMSKEEFAKWKKAHPEIAYHLLNETITNVLISNQGEH